jgi:hypothetical protein
MKPRADRERLLLIVVWWNFFLEKTVLNDSNSLGFSRLLLLHDSVRFIVE